MEVEQTVTTPTAQQERTLIGGFCKCLFTTIFYLQLILISCLVIYLALRGLVFTKSPNFHPKKWYIPLLTSVGLSGVLSLAWQYFFFRNKAATVKATFYLAPLLTISIGILIVMGYRPLIGLPFVIFSLGQALCCFCVSRKRQFTYRMMTRAIGTPRERTKPIIVLSVILSVLYSGFMVAGIGGATATRSGLLDILYISIIMISLAWNMQVLKDVQEVAISKLRYSYFKHFQIINACDALCTTMKSQIGSVCIGSTLVPVFVLIRGIIQIGSDDSYQTMYASDRGCYWLANRMILYVNRYAFVHVGVHHNKSFVQASNDTWLAFRRTAGLEELIDSDLTTSICFLAAIAVGAISSLTSGIWAFFIHKDYVIQLTLYAFIIGYFVARVASAWIQGSVMGYYVAYAENPQSDMFDDMIPQRIARQNIEEAQRREPPRVREPEDDEISYM